MRHPVRLLSTAILVLMLGLLPSVTHADSFEAFEGVETENGHATNSRISFHGYGELHFNIPETGSTVPDQDDPAVADLHRMVWGISYRFSDRITLHTEVDFEHAATEIELEFAYIDFMVNPWVTVRAGSVLMPIGPLNEFHEPTLFYSVERPAVQARLIPTTWQEAAAGVVGEWMGVRYRMYLTSGLDASGFDDRSGLRGGRGHAAEQPSSGLAYAGRVEYVGIPGLTAGVSAFIQPQANQRNTALGDPGVRLFEGDLRIRKAGFDLQGVVVHTRIKDARNLSDYFAGLVTPLDPVGEILFGWYVEAAYHLLNILAPQSDQDLVVFARFEKFDTQAKMPAGCLVAVCIADPANNREIVVVGLSYLPLPPFVAIKADYERWQDGFDDHGYRVNLGLAYQFY